MSPVLRVVRRVFNEIHGIHSGSMRRHAIIQTTLQEEQPLLQIEQLFMCVKSFMHLVNNTEAKNYVCLCSIRPKRNNVKVQSRIWNTRANVQHETNSHSLQQVKNRNICQKPYKVRFRWQ